MVCLDTMTEGASPLAPLDISPEGKAGPNPRLANGIAPNVVILTPLRVSLNDAQIPRK